MLRFPSRAVLTAAARLMAAMPLLMISIQPLAAEPPRPGLPLPPGYVEEPEVPPEDPLPLPPKPFAVIPDEPLVVAPDAAGLLKDCKQPAFTDCFRLWQPPPPPPPEPEKETAGAPPVPPSPPDPANPKAPREPAQGGPVPPPSPDPAKAAAAAAADRATFDALSKALKDSGLDGRVLLTDPKGGDPVLKLDAAPGKPAAKR